MSNIEGVRFISAEEIEVANRLPGHTEFRGVLKSGEKVVCVPLQTMYKEETPRIVSVYASLSNSLHVQKFFGVLKERDKKEFAVMEDLLSQTVHTLKDARTQDNFISASQQCKIRLCYEIANTVAFLHSVNLVVKIISDSSIYLRFQDEDILPIFADLESARLVCPYITSHRN